MGGAVSDIVLTPTDASATYTLSNSGAEESTPAAVSNTWLLFGAASDYEVRATLNSGALTSGTVGAWTNLGVTQSWNCTRTLNSAGVSEANLTIEVGRAGAGIAFDSAVVTLYAEVAI